MSNNKTEETLPTNIYLDREDLERFRIKDNHYGFKVYKLPIKINGRKYLIEKMHEWESSFALAKDLEHGAEHQYYTSGLWLDYGSSDGDIDLTNQIYEFKFT